MHSVVRGGGRPLLLVHGLGSSWQSWEPILPLLAAERTVIAVDLPGFGRSPPLPEVSVASLADAVARFLEAEHLLGVDLVGSSMGARLVLELARRGVGGACIALDPDGFWSRSERLYFEASLRAAIALVRRADRVLPRLTARPVGRAFLLGQLCAHPTRVDPRLALRELRGYAESPSFDDALDALVDGPPQEGAPKGTVPGPLVIGWGAKDRLLRKAQARRAAARFPDAELHWIPDAGHYPHWDQPEQTAELILKTTGAGAIPRRSETSQPSGAPAAWQ